MSTTQARAIAAAQTVQGLMTQFDGLRASINEFVTEYNDEGYSTIWANMATAPLNADGSFGTADNTPNTAHPITVGGINRSQVALVNGVNFFEAFQAFLSNQAVTTANRNTNIDDLVN